MRTNSSRHLRSRPAGKWNPTGILLEGISLDSPWRWEDLFGPSECARPVEVEIGVGKGAFLLARAKQRPDVNLLGIEYARAYAEYAADRVRRAGLENVRVLCADAAETFRTAIPPASVFRVHVYFPDPWPKRKHHRRRLLQGDFFHRVRRALQTGGQMLIVTDHREYFEQILRARAAVEGFVETAFPVLLDSDAHLVGTNFEKKYARQGRTFYRLALLKRSDATSASREGNFMDHHIG